MSKRLQHWRARLTRTRGFQPVWIVLAVGATAMTAALILIPAELLTFSSRHAGTPHGATQAASPPPAPAPVPAMRSPIMPAIFHPPGSDSFNGGAGMARVATAAEFIHANMPLGQGGSLSAQEAWDVAQFVNSHDRPSDPRGSHS